MIITVDGTSLPTSSQDPVLSERVIEKVQTLASGKIHRDIIARKVDIVLSYGYLGATDIDTLLDISENQIERTVVYEDRDGTTNTIQATVRVDTWNPRNIYSGVYQYTKDIRVTITEV